MKHGPDSIELQTQRTKAAHLAFGQMLHSHSIPTDWMECRLLRGRTSAGQGYHLQFVVDRGGPTLLPHVKALEATFMRHLQKLSADASQWVLDIAWVLNDEPGEPQPTGWTGGAAAGAPRAAR